MLYFLLYMLLNMFRATMCPSSGADDWLVVGSVSIEGFVATNPSTDTLPTNRFWQPYCSHSSIPTRGENTNQSSAPDDGDMVARNMLSNL